MQSLAPIELGGCIVHILRGGAFRLDGGTMFGIIPKALWMRRSAADEHNRIPLACNCLLIDFAEGRRVIVEVGHGPKYAEKERGMFAIDAADWLLPELTRRGVDAESIDDVVLTHLHFDHAGGLTWRDGDRLRCTFAQARVHVQRQEFADARANFGIMTNTYREENFSPIDAADAWALHDGAVEALPGVRLEPSRGHTRGHQSVRVVGRDRSLLFLGDVMPTLAHVGAPWNMAYDLLPLDNRETKRRLLGAAAEQDWLLCLDHEPVSPLVRVRREGDWFSLEPA